jgi:ribosomal protein S18 acetylase RimI-like enzyme
MNTPHSISFRTTVRASDADAVRQIVTETGFFSPAEIDIAEELVDERLEQGAESGYEFVFADLGDETIGYACFGEIPCTVGSYDLYWIAVRPSSQGTGLGRRLMEAVENALAPLGARLLYLDTSGREQYQSTRGFYLRCGFEEAAVFDDFYAPGDAKIVYVKRLNTKA